MRIISGLSIRNAIDVTRPPRKSDPVSPIFGAEDDPFDAETVVTSSLVTKDWLRKERARELYWEGHRRTDLIRYGLYHSKDYMWPYKGSDASAGKAFDEYMTVFAIPPTELAANDYLYQNYGYPRAK